MLNLNPEEIKDIEVFCKLNETLMISKSFEKFFHITTVPSTTGGKCLSVRL